MEIQFTHQSLHFSIEDETRKANVSVNITKELTDENEHQCASLIITEKDHFKSINSVGYNNKIVKPLLNKAIEYALDSGLELVEEDFIVVCRYGATMATNTYNAQNS